MTEKPPPDSPARQPPRREERDRFDISLFWRESTLWPVTITAIGGLSALGAGAVSMALTQRNWFARAALALAALTTLFALYDTRSRKGKLGAGALLAALLWGLSIAGGFALAELGD
ncbi:MAG TPA: hypothetical protein VFT98_11515 [Myxococcota bacterium]|nr:hypothetical protein [Myxococcota bacterium]